MNRALNIITALPELSMPIVFLGIGTAMVTNGDKISYWLAGTTQEEEAARLAASPFKYAYEGNTRIMTDTRTGCQYIMGDGPFSVSRTPLLTADGKPDCSGERKP